jgi:hypothetical protein
LIKYNHTEMQSSEDGIDTKLKCKLIGGC